MPEFVEGLAKGLAVIESFDVDHSEMTLSEVARRTRTSPSSARRSLLTLMALGYVGQSNKRFYLKPRVMRLGSADYFTARIDQYLMPELRQVVDKFGDASSVGTLDGEDALYLAHVSVQRARRAMATVGARYPAYATSLGRVMLAGLPDDVLDAYFEKLEPRKLTSQTVVDKSALRDLVLQVRQDGFATTVDQLDYGITALAVPIRSDMKSVVAALNSSGYTGMVTPEKLIAERLETLRQVAEAIAASIGLHPALAAALSP